MRRARKGDKYEVFKTIIEVAETVGKTPYDVDKRIWLVCTGNFYYDNDKPFDNKNKELIEECIKLESKPTNQLLITLSKAG